MRGVQAKSESAAKEGIGAANGEMARAGKEGFELAGGDDAASHLPGTHVDSPGFRAGDHRGI